MTPITRRKFLCTGAAGAALSVVPCRAGAAVPEGRQSSVLVDLTRCIGCRACESACRIRWGQPGLPPSRFGHGPGEGRLSFTTRTYVDFRDAGKTPVKKQCMHCLDPACVSACPVAALHKTPRGSVVYNAARCIGCRYCMVACPFNVPGYEWQEGLAPRVGKCDFCDDRVAAGLMPACATACPTGALKFGKRADILQEARARMSSQPKRYVSIYGDKVVGGTAWIYLSDAPMSRLGFREDLPDFALPSLTWKALGKIPFVVIGVGLLMSVVYRLRRSA